MTLAELKSIIQDYLQNSETTFVNNLDEIIKTVEERIFEDVQFDNFRKTSSLTFTAGNKVLTTPTDFVLAFSLAVIDSNSDYHYLDKKHPSFMQEYTVDPTDVSLRGLPKYYGDQSKQLSGSSIVVAPVPDQNYNVELNYLYKPNSLVTDTTGTWLSQNARNGLIYGCLVEAYTFMKGDADLLQLYAQRYDIEIARLKNRAEGRGRRDEYRYDSLRTPVR
jgi:hypothetical protein|tara:strand:+ start:1815 stop:2474 length:660 start_codon:yes stop_codon:yes gene_type:complete